LARAAFGLVIHLDGREFVISESHRSLTIAYRSLMYGMFRIPPWNFTEYVGSHFLVRGKDSRNRPSVAQRVPGSLGSQISMTFST